MNFSLTYFIERLNIIIKLILQFSQLIPIQAELILQLLSCLMLMTNILNKLLIILRRPGRRVQRTHIMHILTRAGNAFAQVSDLLLDKSHHGLVLVVEIIAFVD